MLGEHVDGLPEQFPDSSLSASSKVNVLISSKHTRGRRQRQDTTTTIMPFVTAGV